MSQADKLRKLLAGPGMLVLPGCFDALSARLIERAGYPGAFMGGFAVSASRIGVISHALTSLGKLRLKVGKVQRSHCPGTLHRRFHSIFFQALESR